VTSRSGLAPEHTPSSPAPEHAGAQRVLALRRRGAARRGQVAEQHYRRALDADPRNVFALCSLAGVISDARGSAEEAARLYDRALEAPPRALRIHLCPHPPLSASTFVRIHLCLHPPLSTSRRVRAGGRGRGVADGAAGGESRWNLRTPRRCATTRRCCTMGSRGPQRRASCTSARWRCRWGPPRPAPLSKKNDLAARGPIRCH